MPRVARNGDQGPKGVIKTLPRSHKNKTDGPDTAVKGDQYLCQKHNWAAPNAPTLVNGCVFVRIEVGGGKMQPVAMQYATKATCGCRIMTASGVHSCCPHLDEKAKRLAEREALIDKSREAAGDPKASGATAEEAAILNSRAETLERLNRDIRPAEFSAATYLDPKARASLTSGFGNAPEGSIRLTDAEFNSGLPEKLRNSDLWNDDKSGFHADLYYDELTGQHWIAYRGTESKLNDAQADFEQSNGLQNGQYDRAMLLGETASRELGPDAALSATGHSLGGGLASAGATVGNMPFTTVNAQGLHPNTVSRYTDGRISNTNAAGLGTAYNTSKDPLTWAQTPEGSRAVYSGAESGAGGMRSAGSGLQTAGGLLGRFPLIGQVVGAAGSGIKYGGDKLGELAEWSQKQTGGQLPPTPAGTRYEIPTEVYDPKTGTYRDGDWIDGHGSGTVIDSMEGQKIRAEGAMKRLLRRLDERQGRYRP
jgi:hypothetical protein